MFPSWRYHKSGSSLLIHDPDQEPKGEGWRAFPWPPPAVQVKLAPCCEKLKEKFDKSWAGLVTERDLLKVALDAARAERDGAVMDLDALQRELDAVTTQLAKRALAEETKPEEKKAEPPPKAPKPTKAEKKDATPAE